MTTNRFEIFHQIFNSNRLNFYFEKISKKQNSNVKLKLHTHAQLPQHDQKPHARAGMRVPTPASDEFQLLQASLPQLPARKQLFEQRTGRLLRLRETGLR